MFEPMFRNTVNVAGVDADVIVFGLGIAFLIVNLMVIRRTLDIEPEVHSFRATAPSRPNLRLRAGLGLGFVAIALAVIALPR